MKCGLLKAIYTDTTWLTYKQQHTTMKSRKINKVEIMRRVGMRTVRIRKKEESHCIKSDTVRRKAQLQREEESCWSILQEKQDKPK